MGLGSNQKVSKINVEYTYNQESKQQQIQMKKKKLIRRLCGIGVIAVIMCVFIITTLIRQSQDIEQRLAEKAELEKQLLELKEAEKAYNEEITKLENDEYIAKIARNEYFLSNEGEVIFKISE